MCGLVGIVNCQDKLNLNRIYLSNSVISHRGPDHTNTWNSDDAFLGHQRLSVMDLDTRSNQPMLSPCTRFVIVFNGEIYNFKELKQQLTSKGHKFKSHGDTEIILHAYLEWQETMVHKLDGMFTIAIWDTVNKNLFLARDKYGEKPLFYAYLPNKGLIFASEIKSIIQDERIADDINPQALRCYLENSYILEPMTIYKNIHKFPAGHFGFYHRDNNLKLHQYWDPGDVYLAHQHSTASIHTHQQQFDHAFSEAVASRQRSDVPYGVFLSGGIDSALIAEEAKKNSKHLSSFSSGFDEKGYDETAQALSTANIIGTNHKNFFTSRQTLLDSLGNMVHHLDEPFADTSCLPFYHLAKHARNHITVALTGDGGDELFAGYETYFADALFLKFGQYLPSKFYHYLDQSMGNISASKSKVSRYYKIRSFCHAAQFRKADRAHWMWRRIFQEEHLNSLINPHTNLLKSTTDSYGLIEPICEKLTGLDWLSKMQCLDIKTWMKDDVLVKVDRMTMAHGLESRAPFLDPKILSMAASLPISHRLSAFGNKKVILRNSAANRLGKSLSKRPKQGFSAPVSHWILNHFHDVFKSTITSEKLSEWINPNYAMQLFQEHLTMKNDHGFRLYNLLILGLWLNQTHRKTLDEKTATKTLRHHSCIQ